MRPFPYVTLVYLFDVGGVEVTDMRGVPGRKHK